MKNETVIDYEYSGHHIRIKKAENASRLTVLIDDSEVIINTNNIEEAKRLIRHTLRDRSEMCVNG